MMELQGVMLGCDGKVCRIMLCNFFYFSRLLRAQQRSILLPNHTDPCPMCVRRTLKVCKPIQIRFSFLFLLYYWILNAIITFPLLPSATISCLKIYAEKIDIVHGFAKSKFWLYMLRRVMHSVSYFFRVAFHDLIKFLCRLLIRSLLCKEREEC